MGNVNILHPRDRRDRRRAPRRLGGLLLALAAVTLVVGTLPAGAAEHAVDLGTADSFGVLAGTTVTNTGDSVINGDLGVSPGTAITGFPPGIVNGAQHSGTDAVAVQAQSDTTTAYLDAAGRTPATAVATELGGELFGPGVYQNDTELQITGELTLDAGGDPNAVFVFQAGSTLVTATDSSVSLINGAQACNVFWQVGSDATLGTSTDFIGTVLALSSITANTGATVEGRLLARNGAVTLDNNVITVVPCAVPPTTPPDATATTSDPSATTAAPATTDTVTSPDTADGSGDDSSTTSLPATGVGVAALVFGGALALLLGAALTYRSVREG